jgi:hypothetical protein
MKLQIRRNNYHESTKKNRKHERKANYHASLYGAAAKHEKKQKRKTITPLYKAQPQSTKGTKTRKEHETRIS